MFPAPPMPKETRRSGGGGGGEKIRASRASLSADCVRAKRSRKMLLPALWKLGDRRCLAGIFNQDLCYLCALRGAVVFYAWFCWFVLRGVARAGSPGLACLYVAAAVRRLGELA